jgi:L-lactate dehydrogenase complex protein LldF
MEGIAKAGELPLASSLCGACEEVCPVRIPIAGLLRRLREEAVAAPPDGAVPGRGSRRSTAERMAWKAWAWLNSHPRLNAAATALLGVFGEYLPPVGPLEVWMRCRTEPPFARKGLRRRLKEEGIAHE